MDLVTGVIKHIVGQQIKQESYSSGCQFNENFLISKDCDKQTNTFNNSNSTNQPCSGLSGECDVSAGLICRNLTNGFKCALVGDYFKLKLDLICKF